MNNTVKKLKNIPVCDDGSKKFDSGRLSKSNDSEVSYI